ncbi:MAG: cyclophilin-like fold protein [Candidatus Zipacnadales bacterium]
MPRIRISAGDVVAEAELLENETARRIYEALPLRASALTWGDEIYFNIPVHCNAEPDARTEVEVGDLGYWLAGSGFCIFFGRTPMSTGDKPVAASNVNVFGRIVGDPIVFRSVRSGTEILIEKVE